MQGEQHRKENSQHQQADQQFGQQSGKWSPDEFAKTMLDNVTAFYKKSFEMNPFLEEVANVFKKDPGVFKEPTFTKMPDVFIRLNTAFANMTHIFVQKQQAFLCELLKCASEAWVEARSPGADGVVDAADKYAEMSQMTAAFFAEMANMLLRMNQEITEILRGYCAECDVEMENGGEKEADGGAGSGPAAGTGSEETFGRVRMSGSNLSARKAAKAEKEEGVDLADVGDVSELFRTDDGC
ncbi:MAG: hypothetical protein LBF72_03740 [Holosporales bacterium]|jgi:hypothetical protein|nr:hypothetical protein [Holosporales bacterium]